MRLQHGVFLVFTIILVNTSAFSQWNRMPLKLFPADSGSIPIMVVHYSGDAGFNISDRAIARVLSTQGIPTVGINSFSYFRKSRTPESAAQDLTGVIRHFSSLWHAQRYVIIGYSFGANAIPYIVPCLPENLKTAIPFIVCISPSSHADFEFHIPSWFGVARSKQYPVHDQILSIHTAIPVICFYGTRDRHSIGPALADSLQDVFSSDNGHRFGKKVQPLTNRLLPRFRKAHALISATE